MNSRKLKVRIWDRDEKHFTFDKVIFNCFSDGILHTEMNKYVPQQYTGVTDIHNIEICEGDIISMKETYDTYLVPVIFDKGMFGIKYWGGILSFAQITYPIEIIGTIFENPDLLM